MNAFSALWTLDPQILFLNHGSFGACPRPVLDEQQRIRLAMERQPVRFMVRELESALAAAGAALAAFVGARPEDLVLVQNATHGVNAVLRSLDLRAGDELLVTDHEYNACRNALEFVAARSGARVRTVSLPFPLRSADQVIAAVLDALGPRTRLLLIDHVSSQTALVLPVEGIVGELNARGVDTLVDGAHAPGMVPLDIDALGAAYYVGNCHKWLCAPKGVGFLHVRQDRQHEVRPLAISHGANAAPGPWSRFQVEFGWTGTADPSAMLSVPCAIACMGSLLPGGWSELMARNRELALGARGLLCEALGIEPPCPDAMVASMAALPLGDSATAAAPRSALYLDPWQDQLLSRWRIEVPIIPWPAPPARLLRISAQAYNSLEQYAELAEALQTLHQEAAAGQA